MTQKNKLPLALGSLLLTSIGTLSATSLLLNFHTTHVDDPGPVAAPYLDLTPGHDLGAIPGGKTTWNNFVATTPGSSLSYGDGSAATGVLVTFGSESTAGSGIIDYTSPNINNSALRGTGGGIAGMESLVSNPGSIYGDGNNTTNSAPARTGWLGGAGNTAIGMRIDGLAAGSYDIYVMGRNTNSNASESPMAFFASTGISSSVFDFSLESASSMSNTGVASPDPTAYNDFVAGDNYTVLSVDIAAGESLFLASDGTGSETRGFFNLVQLVAVPEPSTAFLALCSFTALLRRRR
ncbi:MAG: hypothetical protein ACQKBY_05765 [Verrucomicrobiales bacterium]